MGEFSLTHILIVLGLYIIFFGHKKLPDVGKNLGNALRDFKKAMSSSTEEIEKVKQQINQPTEKPKQDQLLTDQKDHDVSKTNRS